MKPIVCVVTPCRNAARYIAGTVESVIGQTAFRSGRAELRYCVVDGASTDGTVQIAADAGRRSVQVISEPDTGMYDALAKGFATMPSDSAVICYVNAGDLFSPTAIDVVLDVFENRDVAWVTGYDAYYNDRGQPIAFRLPYRYRRRLMRRGVYGNRLPALQQESTFWRGDLMSLVDLEVLRSFRLAGDFYLWHQFAQQHDVYIVSSFLGGFRYHGGHLSADMTGYRDEMRRIAEPSGGVDHALAVIDSLLWRAPDKVKKAANSSKLLRYDRLKSCWL